MVFVDSNRVGLKAMIAAKAMEHEVSFVCSNRFQDMVGGRENPNVRDAADRILVIDDPLDSTELLACLAELNTHRQIDAVLSVLDFCALAVAEAARELGLAHTSPTAIRNSQDKQLCRTLIEAAGLASCRHSIVADAAEARAFAHGAGFPVILKPQRGAASLLAAKADSNADLDAYFAADRELEGALANTVSASVLIEEYLNGPLMSVEVIAADGEYIPLMVCARKRCSVNPSIEIGTTMPAPVSDEAGLKLRDYAVAAAKAVGLDFGIFHIEMIFTDHGPVLVEINPRIMGGNMPTLFRLATGVDPYDLLVNLYLHRTMAGLQIVGTPSAAASTRMIGLAEAGVVPLDLDPAWADEIRKHTLAWQFEVEPGQSLKAMESSFNPFYFQVQGKTGAESSLLAEWIIASIATKAGLKLRFSSEDYLFF